MYESVMGIDDERFVKLVSKLKAAPLMGMLSSLGNDQPNKAFAVLEALEASDETIRLEDCHIDDLLAGLGVWSGPTVGRVMALASPEIAWRYLLADFVVEVNGVELSSWPELDSVESLVRSIRTTDPRGSVFGQNVAQAAAWSMPKAYQEELCWQAPSRVLLAGVEAGLGYAPRLVEEFIASTGVELPTGISFLADHEERSVREVCAALRILARSGM